MPDREIENYMQYITREMQSINGASITVLEIQFVWKNIFQDILNHEVKSKV